jgi:CDP-Glycerol:Poly(glycerophosphate) glycerophosphotransferase
VTRLLRSRVWPALALVAGIGSIFADGWFRLACGCILGIAITSQLALIGLYARRRRLQNFWVRLSVNVMLSAAVTGWHVANRPLFRPLTLTGLVLLLTALWCSRSLPADANVVQLQARNLPGAPESSPTAPRWPYGWAPLTVSVFLLLGFLSGTLAVPGWIFTALALVTVATLAAITVPYVRFGRGYRKVLDKLRDFAPVYTMPYDGQSGFHVGLWSPYLERTGNPFTVVTTDANAFTRVPQLYNMPVIFAPTADRRSIRAMLPPSVRAAFYVFNGRNEEFLKIRSVKHVFVHHGDSDKETSFKKKSGAYDVLVVAGQAAIDRYAAHGVRIPREKFKILGRPQIEDIETVTRPISSVQQPVVLYAPTWHSSTYKNNHSSLPIGVAIVSALLARNATVIFRPHPARRSLRQSAEAIAAIQKLLQADVEATSRPHRWGAAADEPTFAELANEADAMVADVSAVVTDFLQSLKPFAMVATGESTEEFRLRYPSSRAAYVIEWDLSTLDEALDAMLGDDPLAPVRPERRTYYLGGYEDGESARAFVNYARSLADGESSPAPAEGTRPAAEPAQREHQLTARR